MIRCYTCGREVTEREHENVQADVDARMEREAAWGEAPVIAYAERLNLVHELPTPDQVGADGVTATCARCHLEGLRAAREAE